MLLQTASGAAGTPTDSPDASAALGCVTIPDHCAKYATDRSASYCAYRGLPANLHLIRIALTISQVSLIASHIEALGIDDWRIAGKFFDRAAAEQAKSRHRGNCEFVNNHFKVLWIIKTQRSLLR
jgi:hypothetical protein